MNALTVSCLLLLMKALHISAWDELYENKDTRKIVRLSYYAKSNKLVGVGIGRTLAHPHGLQYLGVWQLLEALASLSERTQRGWLIRNGAALTAPDIAALLRIEEKIIAEAISHFSSRSIGWLTLEEFTGRPPGESPADYHGSANHREIGGRNSEDYLRSETTTTDSLREREKEKAGLGLKDGAGLLKQQFVSTQAQIRELEAVDVDQRTTAQERQLKKLRARVAQIQKKQSAGDWTPIEE